jgi:type II secretory pathway pseudopilin PulG
MLTPIRIRDESGFMLIELLTATILMTVLISAFSALAVVLVNRNGTITQQAVLATEARTALDSMASEIRGATCNNLTAPVTTATTTQLVFYTPDRAQPYHLQQITYNLSGGSLTRQLAKSTNTGGPPWTMGSALPAQKVARLATNTTVFRYYDSTGAQLSAPVSAANLPNIAKVTVTLTVLPTASHGTGSLTAQSSATLRTPTCS